MLDETAKEKGYALMCVAEPQSDCRIKVIEEVSPALFIDDVLQLLLSAAKHNEQSKVLCARVLVLCRTRFWKRSCALQKMQDESFLIPGTVPCANPGILQVPCLITSTAPLNYRAGHQGYECRIQQEVLIQNTSLSSSGLMQGENF